jgi:L-fuculose-phosphate aldolase
MRPSTEWRFHQAIMQKRPDANAVVHAHPTYCTAVAIQRRAIPAIHYMIAIFGGADVPVTDYALFGSPALAAMVADALSDRHGCLMANHGATTLGDTLDRALWRMQELETLAKMYTIVSAPGAPVILSDAEIEETLASIQNYGQR